MSILFNKQPLVVNVELAELIGLNESMILQQIHYWIDINKKANKTEVFKEGRVWTYQTIDQWNEQFPFWSKPTINRIFKKLNDLGLIRKGNFNKKGYDRTVWYSINYERLEQLENEYKSAKNEQDNIEKVAESVENTHSINLISSEYQIDTIHNINLISPIQENKKRIKKEINISSSSKKEETEEDKEVDHVKSILSLCQKCDFKLSKKKLELLLQSYSIEQIKKAIVKASTASEEIKVPYKYLVAVLGDMETTKVINNTYKAAEKKSKFVESYPDAREYDYDDLEKKLLGWED